MKNLNVPDMPVYRDGVFVGNVYRSATSIGAAKLAKTDTARMERRNGRYVWLAFNHTPLKRAK